MTWGILKITTSFWTAKYARRVKSLSIRLLHAPNATLGCTKTKTMLHQLTASFVSLEQHLTPHRPRVRTAALASSKKKMTPHQWFASFVSLENRLTPRQLIVRTAAEATRRLTSQHTGLGSCGAGCGTTTRNNEDRQGTRQGTRPNKTAQRATALNDKQ